MVNGLCQSFCFITWQHLLRGSFLSSTLLFNGQWSVSVFLFYNMITPIKTEAPYPPHCYLMVNGLCQSFCFINWQHLLRGSFLSSTLLMVLCHPDHHCFLSSTSLMVNDLCQSFCFITWQHLLRGTTHWPLLGWNLNGLCQSFCFITWQPY